MPIDWFTVIAQAINFLILVWLLKRFLYKPILQAIDEREKLIAAQLAQAEAKKAEAQKERDEFQHKNEAFDRERAALLKVATDEAQAERQRLIDKACQDADSLRAKRQEALRKEQQDLHQDIVRWTQKQVFAIARKALADLAATSLEQCMADVFIQRLGALTGAAKEQLAQALKTSTQPARVRSAFDLPPEQQAAIQKALNDAFADDIPIQFETAAEVVSGIELSTNGQKIAWSISDYLAMLEKSAAELVPSEAPAEAKLEPKAEAIPKSVATAEQEPAAEVEPGLESAPSALRGSS